MRVDTTKSGFKLNRSGKNIIFSNNFNIEKIETLAMLFFECKFHFRMTKVHEIFDQLSLNF